jgi:thiol-disulfide isomerase/thioredoxin/YHS domain-containing protein
MHSAKIFLLAVLGISSFGNSSNHFAYCKEPQIQWSEDLASTMRLANQTGKPVLVHFYGDHCPPCRMLEKKAFKDPQLIQAMTENLLVVRINAEKDTKTAAQFRVNRWPTDVYLFPDGQEIYRNISAQDPHAYEKTVLKVAEKNQRMIGQLSSKRPDPTRAQLLAMQSDSMQSEPAKKTAVPLREASSQVPSPSQPVVVSLAGPARVRLSEVSITSVDTADVAMSTPPSVLATDPSLTLDQPPRVIEVPEPSVALSMMPDRSDRSDQSDRTDQSDQTDRTDRTDRTDAELVAAANTEVPQNQAEITLPASIAMNGFCPVSLAIAIESSRSGGNAGPAWVKGKPEFAVRHRGRVYHCTSHEARVKFLEQPDLYSPVLSGCDLVEYAKSGKWIDGDCRFGFIDKETGRIFLFSSSLNCQEFAQNCESYSTMVDKPAGR